jgi:ABC-type sugar transport system substrate-binding protein
MRAVQSALVTAAATGLVVALAACGSASSTSQGSAAGGAAAAPTVKPIAGRVQPVRKAAGKKVKIALISFPASNEFFAPVKLGADKAGAVLKSDGGSVDYITVNDFTQDAVNAATRAALLQGYDAVGIVALDAGVCPVIKEAVAKHIKVATFIVTAPCVKDAGALFFHGEDLYNAWKNISVPSLKQAIGADPQWQGKNCKVGVITGSFSVPSHEEMRKGILDGLKQNGLSAVSSGVEISQDLSKVGPAVRAYVAGNPIDLCGIAIDIGDAGAGAAALSAAQAKHIKVLSADLTVGGVKQMRTGKQAVLIGQDPFGESYDTAVMLYNAVVTGKDPGFYQPVKDSVMTKDNIDQLLKDQTDGTPQQ